MALTIDTLVTRIIGDPATKQRCFDLSYDVMPVETGIDNYTAPAGGRLPKVPDAQTKFSTAVTNYNATIVGAPTPAAGIAAAAGAHAPTHQMLSWLLAKYNVNDPVQVARNDLVSKPGAVEAAFDALWADPAKRSIIGAPAGATKDDARKHYITNITTNPAYRNSIAEAAAPDLCEARKNQYHFRKIPAALLLAGGLMLASLIGCPSETSKKVMESAPWFGGAAVVGLGLFYGLRKRY